MMMSKMVIMMMIRLATKVDEKCGLDHIPKVETVPDVIQKAPQSFGGLGAAQ